MKITENTDMKDTRSEYMVNRTFLEWLDYVKHYKKVMSSHY